MLCAVSFLANHSPPETDKRELNKTRALLVLDIKGSEGTADLQSYGTFKDDDVDDFSLTLCTLRPFFLFYSYNTLHYFHSLHLGIPPFIIYVLYFLYVLWLYVSLRRLAHRCAMELRIFADSYRLTHFFFTILYFPLTF